MKKRENPDPVFPNNFPILFENASMVVIDKPIGVVVNRADSVKEKTVQDWMEENYRVSSIKYQVSKDEETTNNLKEFINRSGVVHRLDKETSGILVLSKYPEAFSYLKDQFKSREVTKKYTALVHGRVEPSEGAVNAPIGRLPWNRLRFGVFTGGRESLTHYKVQKEFQNLEKEPLTLLTVTPHTGRTHQIRVHLQYIHHPIVGDLLYGGRKSAREDRTWCPRLFLHASELTLKVPETGEKVTITSPMPDELGAVLKNLKVL